MNDSSSSISEDNMEAGPSQQFSASTLPGLPGVPELAPIMKPDIVFFGEGLGDEFHNAVAADKEHVDLLIMIGSSLKVIYQLFVYIFNFSCLFTFLISADCLCF